MKKLSIGFRLTLWYLAIFVLGEIIFAGGMYLILRHNLYDLVDDSLESQVDDLKSFLRPKPADVDNGEAAGKLLMKPIPSSTPATIFALYDSNGESLYHSNSLQGLDSLLIPAEQVKRPDSESRRIDNRPFRFLFQKLTVNGRVFTVEMGIPADDAVDTLQLFRRYLLMFAPGLLIVAAGVGYWMSRKALSPVDELVRTAREVSGTNLSLRLQKLDTGDELPRLRTRSTKCSTALKLHFTVLPSSLPMPRMNCARPSLSFAPKPSWRCAARAEKPNTRNLCATFCLRRNEPPG